MRRTNCDGLLDVLPRTAFPNSLITRTSRLITPGLSGGWVTSDVLRSLQSHEDDRLQAIARPHARRQYCRYL
jgi:hypothetical protein